MYSRYAENWLVEEWLIGRAVKVHDIWHFDTHLIKLLARWKSISSKDLKGHLISKKKLNIRKKINFFLISARFLNQLAIRGPFQSLSRVPNPHSREQTSDFADTASVRGSHLLMSQYQGVGFLIFAHFYDVKERCRLSICHHFNHSIDFHEIWYEDCATVSPLFFFIYSIR